MGKIVTKGKWNLQSENWILNPKEELYGRSFAIAEYDKIINDEKGKTNYILIAQGSRVEDHTKNFKTIKEKEVRIDNVLTYFSKENANYDIQLFLMDADAPIIEDAKLLANYIDSLAVSPNTNSINIVGLSKCSAMSFYVPSFFKSQESFKKTNLFNIAAPYTGTKLASPLIFYPEVKKFITAKIGNNKLSDSIYNKLINFYESISSNSHMDYDIAIPNGIPEEKFSVYDKSFIENIFSLKNINSIKSLNNFKNFVTSIDKNTLKEAIKTMNLTGIGLCLLNDLFFEGKSDGMVYTESQRKVEEHLDLQSYFIASHHDVNSNTKVFNKILDSVKDTIEESNEKQLFLKRKNL